METEKKNEKALLGIGIDTGGTYTDAVIVDLRKNGEVLAKGKALTTKKNLEEGIENALDALPPELLRKVKILSLSTTLATNACVEKKGCRAKLILLGSSEKVLRFVNAEKRYGIRDDNTLTIDSKSVYEGNPGEEAEFYQMMMEEKEWLTDAQALAVAEVQGMCNGAILEKFTKSKLKNLCNVPIVMANEMATGLNILERGATALLNAQLLFIIRRFIDAVGKVLSKKGLDITEEMIVRSDGSLMSDKIAESYPVETILSGPASSVIGARSLARSKNCLIVDMGGTTTDISLVKEDIPKMTSRISIGGYKTQVQGVYIDTFGLGGDSRILISHGKAALDTRRVEPLCVGAAKHPEMVEKLQKLVDSRKIHSKPLHEFLYLLKEPTDPKSYTKAEMELVALLKEGPVMLGEDKLDVYSLKTERLEKEELIMRCGLTPTDIMHIRGDFEKYDKKASLLGAEFLKNNQTDGEKTTMEEFCSEIYNLVCKKLYVNIVKILAKDTYPLIFSEGADKQFSALVEKSFENRNGKKGHFDIGFETDMELVGIGAPTHLFLGEVGKALGMKVRIPENAEYANAVGAITADVDALCQMKITPHKEGETNYYSLYTKEGEERFKDFEKALERAKILVKKRALKEAESRGAVGEPEITVFVDSNIAHDRNNTEIELDTTVTASAKGKVYR